MARQQRMALERVAGTPHKGAGYLAYLDAQELARVGSCSRALRAYAMDDNLWTALTRWRYPEAVALQRAGHLDTLDRACYARFMQTIIRGARDLVVPGIDAYAVLISVDNEGGRVGSVVLDLELEEEDESWILLGTIAPRGSCIGLNLQRLLQDVVAVLTPEARKAFRSFVQTLKTKRDSGLIPSLSEALMRDGPAVVGVDIWNEAVAKQQ